MAAQFSRSRPRSTASMADGPFRSLGSVVAPAFRERSEAPLGEGVSRGETRARPGRAACSFRPQWDVRPSTRRNAA